MNDYLRLGINVDHVATIRNARGAEHPDPVKAAQLAATAGADIVTAHLREDRRHILENDIARLKNEVDIPLNLEMAATEEMLNIALNYLPYAACIVPEKREEKTTEGGLNVAGNYSNLEKVINNLANKDIRVSMFIEPENIQIDAVKSLGAPVIELHTGRYCNAIGQEEKCSELRKLRSSAKYAAELGLECHAGHGLGFNTVEPIARIQEICELNIGHFLIGEAIFIGLDNAVRNIRSLMEKARKNDFRKSGD